MRPPCDGTRNERLTRLARPCMGIWELDIATRQTDVVSDNGAGVWSSPEQAPSDVQGFFQLIHPDDRQMVEASFSQAEQRGNGLQGRISRALARWQLALDRRPRPALARASGRVAALARRQHGYRRAQNARGAVPAGAEDGSRRTAGRRGGARLQQPADVHPRLLGLRDRQLRSPG